MKKYLITFGLLGMGATKVALAQSTQEINSNTFAATSLPTLKYNFKGDSDRFVHFNIWSQAWMRTGDLNPGSMIGDEAADSYMDAGIRRLRVTALLQLHPKYRIYVHGGINNQSFTAGGGTGTGGNGIGKKPGFFFHDAYNEFTVVDRKKWSVNIGAGLHGWAGISRLTNGSSGRMLGADFPTFNFPYLERGDQFGRQMGIYAQGNIHKVNYRAYLNKPFRTDMTPTAVDVAVDHSSKSSWAHGAYAYYQIFDTEKPTNPYLAGSYLGEKKVLNIGLGYSHSVKNTQSINALGETKFHNNTVLSADVFAELPFSMGKHKSSVTAYSVFYHYDMGPNYHRTNGIMNPAVNDPSYTGVRALEGAGNNITMLGTGDIWFTQVGWLLPKFKNGMALQPYVGYTYKKLEAIPNSFYMFNSGVNFLIDKHNAKLSLQYTQQPIHHAITKQQLKNVGEFLLQAQILL